VRSQETGRSYDTFTREKEDALRSLETGGSYGVNMRLGKSTLLSQNTGRSGNTFTTDKDDLQRSIRMHHLCVYL
jgi:hypothetical protein